MFYRFFFFGLHTLNLASLSGEPFPLASSSSYLPPCLRGDIASLLLSPLPQLKMATRGAANRGGGPATFVGSVRKWALSWEETELPSYGAVSSNPGAAPRRMRLLRWARTGE